jgi:erythrocyte band 7 integral membrane protein
VILHPEVQKNMQSAAIQKRLSEATIIEAKANVETAKMMKESSEILNSGSAMQIRYLETIQNITNRGGSKVLFMKLRGKE